MRIEECDAVQASAAGSQLSLLAHHIIGDKQDLTPLQALACGNLLRLFLVAGIQDPDPFASVPEDRDPLQPFLIGIEIQVLRLFHRETVGYIYRGTDRRVNMGLPDRLHINSLPVPQRHRRHEIIRQVRVIFDPVLLHIALNDLCINLVVYVCSVE